MTTTIHSTTIDRAAELNALRDELFALHGGPQFGIRDAAECALGQLAGLLDYATEWDRAADDMLLDAYWPAVDSIEEVTEPEPEPPAPPTPAGQRARDKALWHLAQGACLVQTVTGDWLVPSGSRAAIIHRVIGDTCTCEAGQHGRPCWHVEATKIAAHQEQGRAA